MKTQVIAFIFLFSFLPTQAQSQSQCKEDYAGTNTGLGCEVSANGNGRIFLEDDEGNSKTVKMGKAKRILAREKRQIQRQRDQVRRLLKQTNSEPWQDSASSSKHFDAMVLLSQSFSVPEAQITEEDTIGEARSELITIRSLVKQAIKDNKKTRRSL
ncbi:MAG: hypothetical protein KDD66_16810, partial [Bdellovibrionales bacterium]|nr:hypothetical protein [Bdellovibrionales bacterium]